jgi:hypothetical protein
LLFAPSSGGALQTVTPSNTHWVAIQALDTFIRYKGKRIVNPASLVQADWASSADSIHFEEVEQFVRLVAQSKGLQLWVLQDAKRVNFFIKTEVGKWIELVYYARMGDAGLQESNQYKVQLSNLFGINERQPLFVWLTRLQYTESSLEQFFHAVAGTRKKRPSNDFSGAVALAGLSLNQMQLRYGNNRPTTNFNAHISPVLGLGFLLPMGRNVQRSFVFPQLRLYRYQNEGFNEMMQKTNILRTGLVTAIGLNVGYILFTRRDTRVFFSPGIHYLFLHNNTFSIGNANTSATAEQTGGSSALMLQAGALTGKRWLITINYSFHTNTTNLIYFSGWHSNFQLMAGFRLRK